MVYVKGAAIIIGGIWALVALVAVFGAGVPLIREKMRKRRDKK